MTIERTTLRECVAVLALATLTGIGCDNGILPPERTGGIRVTVSTTGATGDVDPDGYTLSLDGGAPQTVGANATLTLADLAPGNHLLRLAGLAPNCSLSGTNPLSVDVVLSRKPAESVSVSFSVSCLSKAGSLRITRRIAFVGRFGKDADIYLIDSNGNGETGITTATGADLDPAWSPDGSKIAFASERDGNFEIYLMGSSGENPVRLTQNSASDIRPAWSPDGSRIAFVRCCWEIYVMNADGTNEVRLTSDVASNSDPDWSPDGTRIAFSRQKEGITAIWIMNADGSDARQITSNGGGDYQPAWSPDGARIAFSRGYRGIYFVSSDGSSIVPLVTDRGHVTDPSWSPDGRNLAFATVQCDPFQWYYDQICAYSLEIIGADGTGRLAIAQSNQRLASNPAWRP